MHSSSKARRANEKAAALIIEGNEFLQQHRLVDAETKYREAITQAPRIPEAHNNLGTLLKEQGNVDAAQRCFRTALKLRPGYASAYSNLLLTLQYQHGLTLEDLRKEHETWAATQLPSARVTERPTPTCTSSDGPLIVGLVSADFYYHPGGVFLLPWLENVDQRRFRLIAYSNNRHEDAMSRRLQQHVAQWRYIADRDDESVLAMMREDKVDLLIDLSGHTAGNRMSLFGHRAAAIQASWLGYSSTTGVPAMDYVMMDAYSAPSGYEKYFTERLIRLDGLRFCYSPPAYAPSVCKAPCLTNGHITFGSFNNLAKLTPTVLKTWAEILSRVPGSRLVLKWKSLGDVATQARIRSVFESHGISPDRIECRGWSSHAVMLTEYGDVDIAIDPFPFTGGLTSCDALFMGVPAVTFAGNLPISRQTASFLHALELHEWISEDVHAYVETAVTAARDFVLLNNLRQSLRMRMLASTLCDDRNYARSIEQALMKMQQSLTAIQESTTKGPKMKTFLHVGCGPKRKNSTTKGFNSTEWNELRLDIDPNANPDIVGTMTDMSSVPSESVDAVFSSHNIEHLYPHEVPIALAEFKRVLKPGGFVVITCPDLQSVCALVAEDKLTEPAYISPAGPIAPLDILYGHRPPMARGNLFMAHRCGFTKKVLGATLHEAGFVTAAIKRRAHPNYDLWVVATKQAVDENSLRTMAADHFPG